MGKRREWWITSYEDPGYANAAFENKAHADAFCCNDSDLRCVHVREVLPGDNVWQSTLSEACDDIEELRQQLADLQAKHTRLHDKAETAYNAYDGNGEDAFNELMEDLGREIHGSE